MRNNQKLKKSQIYSAQYLKNKKMKIFQKKKLFCQYQFQKIINKNQKSYNKMKMKIYKLKQKLTDWGVAQIILRTIAAD